MDRKQKIVEFMSRYFNVELIDDDTNFLENGLVSSLFLMQLLIFLENEYHIEISNDEIVPDNFSSINSILKLLSKNKVVRDLWKTAHRSTKAFWASEITQQWGQVTVQYANDKTVWIDRAAEKNLDNTDAVSHIADV